MPIYRPTHLSVVLSQSLADSVGHIVGPLRVFLEVDVVVDH